MYNQLQLARRYLHYYLTASNGKGHGIHSPFVFDLVTRVFNDTTRIKEFDRAEQLRKQMLHNPQLIEVNDFGAGSVSGNTSAKKIAAIAKHAAKSPKWSQLLFRLVKYSKPSVILELGTSLGITTSYLSMAAPDSTCYTMEGAENVAAIAENNFLNMQLNNVSLIKGNFDDTLSALVADIPVLDFVFFDGNHREAPTVRYFETCLTKATADSVFVFDDIHWSSEMERAWASIQQHASVTVTIDLFFIGLVFFKKEIREPHHYLIRY